jgi:hypothetical protein
VPCDLTALLGPRAAAADPASQDSATLCALMQVAFLYGGLSLVAALGFITICICMCCSCCPLYDCFRKCCCGGDKSEERKPLRGK